MKELDIQFRKYDFRFQTKNGIKYIFDVVRKKYVILQPEEWVRQNILHYLIYDLHYPRIAFKIERGVEINTRKKRFDLTVNNKDGSCFILIECKSPETKIDQGVVDQAGRYNLELKAPYVLLTNGNHHIVYCIESGQPVFEDELPPFSFD